jgi:hypothetical protein
MILTGLAWLGVTSWAAWEQWVRVSQWPRANAILMSKTFSSAGARLVFHYEAEGRRFTGAGFRWGQERTMRPALESYSPGTTQKIGYDPHDPSQVETIIGYNWGLFKGSIVFAAPGLLLIAVGFAFYRRSYASWGAS